MTIAVIILAAGQGTRMRSAKPKVLHKLAGKSLLSHVITTVNKLNNSISNISSVNIVHGHKAELVKTAIQVDTDSSNAQALSVNWIEQKEQLGTGHAVSTAVNELQNLFKQDNVDQVLILYGDVPLVKSKDLEKLVNTTDKKSKNNELGLITLNSTNPYGLGRIIRNKDKNIIDIVEQKDATSEQLLISEVNTGIFLLPYPLLSSWLSNLTTNNSQQEYYLTDIIKQAVHNNTKIKSVTVSDQISYLGINNLYQLSQTERHYQFLRAVKLLESGVNIIDPNRIDIRGLVEIQCSDNSEITIDINCIFEGTVKIGKNCIIESNCILKNIELGDNIHIKANSILEEAVIKDNCIIGPFARVRPETVLEHAVHIGNFVEIKKSTIATGTKINHLSYIGDTTIGQNVNIGAGTITCNYDGIKKHQTIIGDGAFVGSNTSLVAPVIIGENSTIGAGSTISKNTPNNKLTVARGRQTTIDNWTSARDRSNIKNKSEE